MRDYTAETQKRVAFIQQQLQQSGAQGIVFGNSGGKDSALVGILCKQATDNTLGVLLPCQSKRNFEVDTHDALLVAEQFGIAHMTVDLSGVKAALNGVLAGELPLSDMASANIAPRLRMTALYAIAHTRNCLVAGTGNRSEAHMGYFTKWGDGAHDFNPIADLTVTEIFEFLAHLGAPEEILTKAPSAGLFDGQTDEEEMGLTYAQIDAYLLRGEGDAETIAKIDRYHQASAHKRALPVAYPGN